MNSNTTNNKINETGYLWMDFIDSHRCFDDKKNCKN